MAFFFLVNDAFWRWSIMPVSSPGSAGITHFSDIGSLFRPRLELSNDAVLRFHEVFGILVEGVIFSVTVPSAGTLFDLSAITHFFVAGRLYHWPDGSFSGLRFVLVEVFRPLKTWKRV
jgi:hypothetical protein